MSCFLLVRKHDEKVAVEGGSGSCLLACGEESIEFAGLRGLLVVLSGPATILNDEIAVVVVGELLLQSDSQCL